MQGTNVSEGLLERLSDGLDDLTPEARKAARYVLENPRDAGIMTVREIADAANVKPNTLIRMAQQIGFDGYEEFREPFREAMRKGEVSLPDRARWLQDIQRRGGLAPLLADMVSSALGNIEETFSGISEEKLQRAGEMIWNCKEVYVLGVGVNNSCINNFAYLARTCMVQFHAMPRAGSTPIDDLAWANSEDVLIAVTCRPYRTEVIEAMKVAKAQGMRIVAISDSPASPIIRMADIGFIVSVDTPQFFPSSVATIALLETLLSFVIANASDRVIERADTFQRRRHELGIYLEEPE